jgi:hypothetical protein
VACSISSISVSWLFMNRMVLGMKTRGTARGFSIRRVFRSSATTRQPGGGSMLRGVIA